MYMCMYMYIYIYRHVRTHVCTSSCQRASARANTHMYTPLKYQNRFRLSPVQRKRSHEKRRCDHALKSHKLRTCKHRSRHTLAQRKRTQLSTQVQTYTTAHTPSEVQQPLSPCVCVAKTFAWKHMMSSSINRPYLRNMHKLFSPYVCAAKTFAGHPTSANILIGTNQKSV